MAAIPLAERPLSLKVLGALLIAVMLFFVWLTWAFFNKAFVDTEDVRAVFLDYNLQKLLYEHARKQKVSESTLDVLFQYPRGKGRNYGIIRHWKGHKDHFHVRFRK